MARLAPLLAIAMLLGGTAAADTTPEIDRLAQQLSQIEMTDPFAAVPIATKLYEAQAKLSGEDAVETVRREEELVSLLVTTGQYTAAIEHDQRLIALAEKQQGASSREVRDRIDQLVGVYELRGDLDVAEPEFQRALAITRQLEGEHSEAYADELMRYADFLGRRQEDAAAQEAYERALQIDDATGSDPGRRLTSLGLSYLKTGAFAKAQQTFARYLARLATSPVTQRVQMTAWVASLYHVRGRDELAHPLYQQAIDLCRREVARVEAASGPEAPELSPLLFTLGWMLHEKGDAAAADPVLTRLVALQEKRKEPFVAYAQLATVRRELGHPKEALALFEKGKVMMGPSARTNTGLNSMMADIERQLGHYARAEELYLAEQAQLDREFGKGAILVSRLHLGLVSVYVAAHQLDKAERVLADNLDIAERELATVLGTGTEGDHLGYFAREGYQLDTAISFDVQVAPKMAAATRLALTTLLRRKGRLLDAAAGSLARIRSKLSPEDQRLLDQLADLRAQLAKLAVAGAQRTQDYAKQVAALEDQIRRLEVTLAGKSAQYQVATQKIELAAVQHKLPRGARLVELVEYQPKNWSAPDVPAPPPLPRRYAAYVLAGTGDPVLVDLGPIKPIDDAIGAFRKALGDPDNDRVAELGRALYDLTFRKIAPALGGTKDVLVAPDGALNLVPFAALHDGKQYLVGEYTFTYLTSGRDLLRLGLRGKAQSGPVIFADPDFDDTSGAAKPSGRRSRAMEGLTWPRLPGTGQEADAIVHVMTGVRVFRGKQATENAIKALHAPSVLHLATHGFFLDEASGDAENPLLESGLAFAGANRLSSSGEDGILTALEASGLDLWGTKLVVLSACETGLGKVTSGDGVYGLRRALVIAGAESLVMSLWQVDDRATRDLMDGYYRRLEAGQGRSAALRDVQLEIAKKPGYAHPYFWASFIAAGDGSPL